MSNKFDQKEVDKLLSHSVDSQKLNKLNYSTNLNYALTANAAEVESLLFELKGSFNKERLDQLFNQTKKDILFSIAGPFGLGKVISAYDKVGGNVDTIHNVRDGIYATDEEKKAYDNIGEYDDKEKNRTHEGNKNYVDKRNNNNQLRQKGELENDYNDETFKTDDKTEVEHVVSTKENYNDPGRVLAEIDNAEISNIEENLKVASKSVNASKGEDSVDNYLDRVEEKNKKIEYLNSKEDLSEKEQIELEKLIRTSDVDENKMRDADEQARAAIDEKLNEYYKISKFQRNTLKTSSVEGLKMGAQQAFGILLVELFSSSFTEIRNAFKEGLEGESLYKDIKIRLKRIGRNLASKWKDVIKGFSGGFISGFISNLITTLINMFVTTGKRFVRMIREGVFSLLKALKIMLFPPENMTFREVTHEAMKLVGAGGVVIAGVALEEIVETMISSIPFLAPFATIITAVIVGSLTAIAMALMTYLIDKMDLLGVIENEQTKYMSDTLDADNKETLKNCEEIVKKMEDYLLPA
ncbi:lactate permease [Candidatus Gracilibacteria bacterium]|nr:lactate permease [Candidatus Gracilibacteria bacterium]